MRHVSDFISAPSAEKDVNVSQVFTDAMFDELSAKMKGVGWSGVDDGSCAKKKKKKDVSFVVSFLIKTFFLLNL